MLMLMSSNPGEVILIFLTISLISISVVGLRKKKKGTDSGKNESYGTSFGSITDSNYLAIVKK